MKSTSLPSIRVELEVREELESVLIPGETLSSFIENAARREANYRKVQSAFLARGRESLKKTRASGKSVSAASAMADLDEIIKSKFKIATSGSKGSKAGA